MRTIIGNIFMIMLCSVNHMIEAERLPIRKRETSSRSSHIQSSVELSIAEHSVFEGQPFYCTVRFTYDKRAYTVKSLLQPVCYNGEVDSLLLLSQRDEQVSGNAGETETYGICEWQILLYPTKQGTLSIEPVQVVAEHKNTRGNSFLGFSFASTNTFFSKPLAIEVLPLPAVPPGLSDGVHVVGCVDSIVLSCDKVSIYSGQACTLKYVIKGLSNASRLSHPVIHLPEELKAYPSTAMKHGDSVTFEYVLQAMKEGRYSIEPQKMVYFDTKDQLYKTCETNPVSLYVMSSNLVSPMSEGSCENAQAVVNALPNEREEEHVIGVAYIRRIEIPAVYFLFIIGSLLITWIIKSYKYKILSKYRYIIKRMRYRKKLYDLETCLKKKASYEIIRFVYESFKDLHHMINFDKTMKTKQDEWQHFLRTLEIMRFNEDNRQIHDDILKQLREWITYLKKI